MKKSTLLEHGLYGRTYVCARPCAGRRNPVGIEDGV